MKIKEKKKRKAIEKQGQNLWIRNDQESIEDIIQHIRIKRDIVNEMKSIKEIEENITRRRTIKFIL